MLTAILIDDESHSRETLRGKLKLFCPEVKVVGEGGSVAESLALLKTHKPDALFLDIDLSGESGFDLLEQLPVDGQPNPAIIFITAHDEFAIKAIKFSALDYLLKPIDPEELVGAVRKLEEEKGVLPQKANFDALLDNMRHDRDSKRVVIPTSEGMNVLRLDDIIRLESSSNYTKFYLKSGGKLMASRTLKEYDNILSDYNFIRVHKSHLVNLDFITRYVHNDGGYLVLNNGEQVSVSNRKKEALMKLLRSI